MKKFKFNLQSVLDAREKNLENCQLALSKILHKLKLEEEQLQYLYDKLESTLKALEKVLSAGSNIDLLIINSHQGYILKIKKDINNQHKLIADTEITVEECKKTVVEALKAKTMLEKLKEKALRQFKIELEKHDMAEIDEIATSRFIKAN